MCKQKGVQSNWRDFVRTSTRIDNTQVIEKLESSSRSSRHLDSDSTPTAHAGLLTSQPCGASSSPEPAFNVGCPVSSAHVDAYDSGNAGKEPGKEYHGESARLNLPEVHHG